MSFKCPKCKKDFGYNYDKLNEHFKESKECVSEAVEIFEERMDFK